MLLFAPIIKARIATTALCTNAVFVGTLVLIAPIFC